MPFSTYLCLHFIVPFRIFFVLQKGVVCVWQTDSRGGLNPIRQYRKKGMLIWPFATNTFLHIDFCLPVSFLMNKDLFNNELIAHLPVLTVLNLLFPNLTYPNDHCTGSISALIYCVFSARGASGVDSATGGPNAANGTMVVHNGNTSTNQGKLIAML